jgi:DNA-binding response OmpR family regulator
MLPDIDGLEVLRNIKEKYGLPVIMITAYGNKKVALKNWKYLPDCYFDKPFRLKELKEKVKELLKPSKETLPSKEIFPFEAFGLDPSRLSLNTLRKT